MSANTPPMVLPYKLELFLSTDGKHTVHLDIPAGMDITNPLAKASSLYDKIVEKYGLQPSRSYVAKAKPPATTPEQNNVKSYCATCGTEMTFKSGIGKKGPWKALMCPNNIKGQSGHDPVWL